MKTQISKDKLVTIAETAEYTVIYSPAKGLAFRVEKDNAGKINQSEAIKDAPSVKIGGELVLDEKSNNQISLFLTTFCNADCSYCYAKSQTKPMSMNFETAKKGIDFVTSKKQSPLGLLFFGGGEPTLEFPLMKKIKSYTEQLGIKTFMHIQSNGVFSETVLDWLIENKVDVTISCDGPPEIQDRQRPLKGGKKSSSIVENTIKGFLEKYDKKMLGINTTVTNYSVERQTEIVEYFDRLGVEKISLGSFLECNESRRNNLTEVKPKIFSKNFLKAKEFSEQIGISVNSGFLPIHRMSYVCAFCLPQFCLTPDGLVSSCLETVSSDIGPQEFIYGRLSGNKFEFDQEKIKTMKTRRVENMDACKNCFLKYTCVGGCASECLKTTGSIFTPPLEKCGFLKQNVKEYVLFKVKKELSRRLPVLKIKNSRPFIKMHFSDLPLEECKQEEEFQGNPLIEILFSKAHLEKLNEAILVHRNKSKGKPAFFALKFVFSTEDLYPQTGKAVIAFLRNLKKQKVRFLVENNFFPCMFATDYSGFFKEFQFFEGSGKPVQEIKKCRHCVYRYRGTCGGFR